MSDERQQFELVATVTGVAPGNFDGQYTVTLDTVNGEEKASVYKLKRDGTEAKAWPLVHDSMMKSCNYRWTGNAVTKETQYGERTYKTITFGRVEVESNLGTMPNPAAPAQEPPVEEPPAEWGDANFTESPKSPSRSVTVVEPLTQTVGSEAIGEDLEAAVSALLSAHDDLEESIHDAATKDAEYRRAKAEAHVKAPEGTVADKEAFVDQEIAQVRFEAKIAEGLQQAGLELVRSRRQIVSALQSKLSASKAEAEFARTGP